MLYNQNKCKYNKTLEYNLYEVYFVNFFYWYSNKLKVEDPWYNGNHLVVYVRKQLSRKIAYYYCYYHNIYVWIEMGYRSKIQNRLPNPFNTEFNWVGLD